MGIKGSKPCGSEAAHCSSASSPSPPRVLKNKRRHKPSRVLQSSCLGRTSWYRSSCFVDKICDGDDKTSGSAQLNADCSRKSEAQCGSSNAELNNWNEPSASSSGEPSSSPSSRILSRFSFVPGNISFKLEANNPESSRMFTEPQQFISQTQTSNAVIKSIAAGKMTSSQNQATTSAEPQPTISIDTIPPNSHPTDPNQNGFSYFDRRTRLREPTDGNVRFSRTLSVGRLRDRVLRRSSTSYSSFELERQDRVNESEVSVSTMPNATSNTQDSSANSSYLSREARYHNLLEHRSSFLERRRRIRSQRVGSRFENLSGRERSCILSGQHRTANCTCRVTNRGANGDETSAGVSISRIVLLAEALFEVLDEIHQQSVVLSARHTGSSFGSLPAPCDAVEALPLKTFGRSMKGGSDEAAQCYICLVEYEEGDSMRVLPCKHEFHRACVDKWLKDIHRICPLCRGDICSG